MVIRLLETPRLRDERPLLSFRPARPLLLGEVWRAVVRRSVRWCEDLWWRCDALCAAAAAAAEARSPPCCQRRRHARTCVAGRGGAPPRPPVKLVLVPPQEAGVSQPKPQTAAAAAAAVAAATFVAATAAAAIALLAATTGRVGALRRLLCARQRPHRKARQSPVPPCPASRHPARHLAARRSTLRHPGVLVALVREQSAGAIERLLPPQVQVRPTKHEPLRLRVFFFCRSIDADADAAERGGRGEHGGGGPLAVFHLSGADALGQDVRHLPNTAAGCEETPVSTVVVCEILVTCV